MVPSDGPDFPRSDPSIMLNPTSHVLPTTLARKRPHHIPEIPSAHADSSIFPSQQQAPFQKSPVTATVSSPPSSFRNVSACSRCRIRKNRCDQRLPRCQACEKARVRCVGYDPITKREIPRSYVYFLESRVTYLEKLLIDHEIEFKEAVAFDEEEATRLTGVHDRVDTPAITLKISENGEEKTRRLKREDGGTASQTRRRGMDTGQSSSSASASVSDNENEDSRKINNLVSSIGMVSVQGASNPQYLGSTSGISFARVVFAAIKTSVAGGCGPMRPTGRLPHSAAGTGGSTMRDSFFGLQTRPNMKCAALPDRELAEKLAMLYFEYANPQVPILHRDEFMTILDCTYATNEKDRSPRNLYMLNIVFAIGAGIIFQGETEGCKQDDEGSPSSAKRQKLSGNQSQPEEYHASAIVHLESFLDACPAADSFGGLEELQAVLLLASFALLRPVPPGLWYIIGVAMRLAVDLGLHYEDGASAEATHRKPNKGDGQASAHIDTRERGRREWIRDFKRRLWWCVYSLDRLVGCCVGRPFGINDQAINTRFPSVYDDKYITKAGILTPERDIPSYKRVGFHYFKLRMLQSEIQDVLQYRQAKFTKEDVPYPGKVVTRSELTSPFLQGFDSFRSWRRDVHRRLMEWQRSAPTQQDTGVQFPVELLELNYWQAIIMLYQQSLTIPAELAEELTPAEDVSTNPPLSNIEEAGDEQDIYLNVAEAGQKVIRIYRQLHHMRLLNYTYLATHSIFMAGISFLYAIWHSPAVRDRVTLDEVDFTILATTSVLGDLVYLCPPAESCRNAFERMSKATMQMCLSSIGFGAQVDLAQSGKNEILLQPANALHVCQIRPRGNETGQQSRCCESLPVPRSDMNVGDMLADGFADSERSKLWHKPTAHRERSLHDLVRPSSPSFITEGAQQYVQEISPMKYYSKYDNSISPQQQPRQCYCDNSLRRSVTSPSTIASQCAIPTYSDERTFSLDFLGLDTPGIGDSIPMDGNGNVDYSILNLPSLGHGAGHSVGIDLGIGMAMDFQCDWSDNASHDMLEGYFFG